MKISRPESVSGGPIRTRFRIYSIFLLALFILAAFTWSAIREDKKATTSFLWVTHTQDVIRSMVKYIAASLSLESDTRGFVISGEEPFYRDYLKSQDSVRFQLDFLQKLTSDNPVQVARLIVLQKLTAEKISWSNSIIALRRHSRKGTFLILDLNRGKSIIDSIQAVATDFLHEEGRLLIARAGETRHDSARLLSLAILGTLISFFFLVLVLIQLNRDYRLRFKAESEARSSENKYRNLIEDSGVVMFTTNMAGIFTFISNKVTELTGYSKEELIGSHYSKLVAQDWLEMVHLSYRDQLKKKTHETLMEFNIVTKTGERKWVEQMAVIVYDRDAIVGFQCIVKDISEKKGIELELKESEFKRKENQYRLQAIMDNTTSMVFIKDLEGRYLLVNRKFQEVLGVTDVFIYGKTDFEFSQTPDAERYKRVDEMVIHTCQPQEVVEDLELVDGTHYFLITKFPLLDNKQHIFGICGIATDISQRKRYEEQLIRSKRSAEDAEKLQEQFLANMSHEIRTPLNGIIGMTNLLSSTELGGSQSEFVDTIRESSNNLLVIINDILDFSKIKAGKLTLEQIHFNPMEVVNKTVNSFRHKTEEKGLNLETSFDPDIPPSLTGDPYRLNQVLVNLIGNSIKFTEKGEIRVEAKLLNFTMDTVNVQFEVKDTGIGVSEDKWETIFESFAQGSSDTTRKYGGTGLGLAITKKLVDLQDGEIEMQSKVNEGTTFRFSIPYRFTEQNVEDKEAKSENDYLSDLKGRHILVAEDNTINQKVVFYTLDRVGAHVDIASNGKEAIGRLQAGNHYDLILMDIQMPEMDGYQTTRYIRTVLNMQMPIIAMTATVLRGEKEKCIAAGMNDYVSKPFTPSELFKRMAMQVTGKTSTLVLQAPAEAGAGFNLTYLIEIGDEQQIIEILNTFLQTTPGALEEIQASIEAGDWDKVYEKAHRLKSSLGLLQVNQVLKYIGQIEMSARNREKLESLPVLIEASIRNYQSVQSAISEEREKLSQKTVPG